MHLTIILHYTDYVYCYYTTQHSANFLFVFNSRRIIHAFFHSFLMVAKAMLVKQYMF